MTAGRSGPCGQFEPFAFRQDGIFAQLKNRVGNELSKAGLEPFMRLDEGGYA